MEKIALPLAVLVLLNILGHCEMSIYPGLRRKPLLQSLQPLDSTFLSQLMEENARRRLQQQFEQQLELINMQMARQRQRQEQRERYRQQQLQELAEEENDDDYTNINMNSNSDSDSNNNNNNNQYDQYDNPNSEFSYKIPKYQFDDNNNNNNEIEPSGRRPFAVGPFDPRFYEEENRASSAEEADLDEAVMAEYEEYVPAETKQTKEKVDVPKFKVPHQAPSENDVSNSKFPTAPVLAPAPGGDSAKILENAGTATFHRIKPQSAAAAAVAGVNVPTLKPMFNSNTGASAGSGIRHDINALIDKLQKQGKQAVILNHNAATMDQTDQQHVVDVVRQRMGIDGEMGMYVVALIAGMSAAVIVGLIALGVAWCTLRNRAKAAADVEYPAYGVTGPNKDISPSGDRKLAQSAQMYHYQHQKQQIIAMENRQAVEGSCGLSDVESDDDNDEGDYTVYECPGLAPTGEMEVKNPLFLDETPMTPSTSNAATVAPTHNITQATPQQPQMPPLRKAVVTSAAAAAVAAAGKAAATSMATSSEETKKQKKNKK